METESMRNLTHAHEDLREDLTRAKRRLTHLLICGGDTYETNITIKNRGKEPGVVLIGNGLNLSNFPKWQLKKLLVYIS